MGTIYVIRHGQTEENRRGILLGDRDVPLNEEGIRQSHETGEVLKDKGIEIIFSSPLERARHTAEIINEYVQKKILLDERLKEKDIGIYEGLHKKEAGDPLFSQEGESIEQMQERVFSFLDETTKEHEGTMAIVTHVLTAKLINKYFSPGITEEEFFDFRLENAEFEEFNF